MQNKKLLLEKVLVKRKLPENYNIKDDFLFSNEIERELPDLYSELHKNICINSDQYLWKNLSFLDETFFRREKRRKNKLSNFKFLLKSFTKKKRVVDEGLWLIDNWSHGYFHWFGDVLQKYYTLKKRNTKLILPASYSKKDFIISSSKVLKIELEFIQENEIIKCKNLTIVPTSFISGNFYNNIILRIQSKFHNTIATNSNLANKILYLSRELTDRRKIGNDAEIRDLIKKKGGETVILEKMSWVEQLGYFQNCEILISPHGAGLTNMIFCFKKVKVIEFRHHHSNIQNMYFSMSSTLKLNYFYIKCQGKDTDPHTSNINVPIGELNSLLDNFVS
jgi:capsular polysaccharide biosynthesis protein